MSEVSEVKGLSSSGLKHFIVAYPARCAGLTSAVASRHKATSGNARVKKPRAGAPAPRTQSQQECWRFVAAILLVFWAIHPKDPSTLMPKIEIEAEHLQQLIERLTGAIKHLDRELLAHRMFLETLYSHGLDQTEALLSIQTAVDNPSTKAAIDSKYREMEEKIAEQLARATK